MSDAVYGAWSLCDLTLHHHSDFVMPPIFHDTLTAKITPLNWRSVNLTNESIQFLADNFIIHLRKSLLEALYYLVCQRSNRHRPSSD